MIEKITHHKATIFKVLFTVIGVALIVIAAFILVNSQRVADKQAAASQSAVANHTQTLNEIKNAVNELKQSNQADHAQTVTYINCVLVGVTNAPTPAQADLVYKECLTAAGVNTGS